MYALDVSGRQSLEHRRPWPRRSPLSIRVVLVPGGPRRQGEWPRAWFFDRSLGRGRFSSAYIGLRPKTRWGWTRAESSSGRRRGRYVRRRSSRQRQSQDQPSPEVSVPFKHNRVFFCFFFHLGWLEFALYIVLRKNSTLRFYTRQLPPPMVPLRQAGGSWESLVEFMTVKKKKLPPPLVEPPVGRKCDLHYPGHA